MINGNIKVKVKITMIMMEVTKIRKEEKEQVARADATKGKET